MTNKLLNQQSIKSMEFRRQSDATSYRFVPSAPVANRPAWQRTDGVVRLLYPDDHGWVTVNEQMEINGIPWAVPPSQQGALPPTGPWISRKGDKSCVYEILFVEE